MGSATRCHFVNPKYAELHGQPCYPLARGPAGAARRRDRGAQPVARRLGDPGRRSGRRAGGDHPGRRGRRGRRSGRGDAGRRRPDRPRARPRAGRSQLHGRHRSHLECRDLHRRRLAVPAPRRGRRDRPVGLGHGCLRPLGLAGRLLADHQLRIRGRPRHLRLPGLLPRRPGDQLGHPVRGGLQAPRAVPRAGRPGARARQADHGRQGRPQRAGPDRRDRPHGLARRGGTGHRRGARRGRRHPLSRPRRAARDRRAGRRAPSNRSTGRSWTDRRRHGVDRRGLADRRPGADRPGSTCRRSPRRRGHRSWRRCRRWATSATRSIRGVPRTRRPPIARPSNRWPARARYDVLVLVHDFPYRSAPSEVATANEVHRSSCWRRRATGRRSCRSTSRSPRGSRRPRPRPCSTRRAAGRRSSAAPWRRSGRSPAWRRGSAGESDAEPIGPWRPAWPGLAADRTSFGADPSPLGPRGGGGGRRSRALAELESLELVRAAGVPTIEAVRRRRRRRGRSGRSPLRWRRSRSSSTRPGSPTRATSAAWRWGWSATTRSARPPSSCSRSAGDRPRGPRPRGPRAAACSRWPRRGSSCWSAFDATRCSARSSWSGSAGR